MSFLIFVYKTSQGCFSYPSTQASFIKCFFVLFCVFVMLGKYPLSSDLNFLPRFSRLPLSPSYPVGTLLLFTMTRTFPFHSFSSKIWFCGRPLAQDAWVGYMCQKYDAEAVHRNPCALALAIRHCYSMLAKGKRCCFLGE